MKKGFISLMVFAAVSVGAWANAQESKEMMIGVSDAYIPSGFDANSDSFVVVNGIFPNSCYSWARSEVSHPGTYSHEVRSFANVQSGMCLMMMIPFTKEIHLGRLVTGKHTVRFVNGDGTFLEKPLIIE